MFDEPIDAPMRNYCEIGVCVCDEPIDAPMRNYYEIDVCVCELYMFDEPIMFQWEITVKLMCVCVCVCVVCGTKGRTSCYNIVVQIKYKCKVRHVLICEIHMNMWWWIVIL